MQTLWNKGESLDHKILDFTVGNDREIESSIERIAELPTAGNSIPFPFATE